MVPYFARTVSIPITVPGMAVAFQLSSDMPGMTLPDASWNMVAVAAAGAFSRKSKKVERPSARCTVMKPPPPILPAWG